MKTLNELMDFIENIPENMCAKPQPLLLYHLSKNLKCAGAIVEIGTCAGKSTIALAFAQKEKNGCIINTIDIQEHPNIVKNLTKAGINDYVKRIIGRSSIISIKWNELISLLWIDGDHRKNGIVRDIICWSKHVVIGGIMAFHDYPGFDGVNDTWKALYKYVLKYPEKWRVISDREAGSIIAFERIENHAKYKLINRYKFKIRWFIENIKWYHEQKYAQVLIL